MEVSEGAREQSTEDAEADYQISDDRRASDQGGVDHWETVSF